MSAIPLPTLAIIAAAAVLLLGVILLVLGLRGRRINDHPVCRKCRFDLHGVYPASETCPECGRDLVRPRAVRRGERRRRRWAVALGALLLLASLGVIGAGGWATFRGVNLNPYKPAWLLAMEAREPERAAAALAELTGRLEDGALSDARIESLVARALERQADVNQPWLPQWGDLVDAAWAQGRIAQPLYEQYMRQAVDWDGALTLSLREEARRGEPLPITLRINGARGSSRGNIWLGARAESVTVGEREQTMPLHRGGGTIGLGGGGRGMLSLMGPMLDAPEGVQSVEVRWLVSVGPPPQGAIGHPGVAADFKSPPRVEWLISLAGDIKVVAPGAPLIREVEDPSLTEQIKAAIELQGIQVHNKGEIIEPSGSVMLRNLPMPVAFDVYWRAGDHEWVVGEVAAPAVSNYGLSYGHGQHPVPAGFDARAVDVIFRSNPEAALRNPGIAEIWKGEVVFKDVEVEWIEPSAAGGEN